MLRSAIKRTPGIEFNDKPRRFIASPGAIVMRDLTKLLWRDLKSDEERLAFIRSGRAYETGILAKAIEHDCATAFESKIALEYAVDLAGSNLHPTARTQDSWKDILNA